MTSRITERAVVPHGCALSEMRGGDREWKYIIASVRERALLNIS